MTRTPLDRSRLDALARRAPRTPEALWEAFAALPPGGTLVYHVGALARDRADHHRFGDVAAAAFRIGAPRGTLVSERYYADNNPRTALGRGVLVQKRHGSDLYEYRLIKAVAGERRSANGTPLDAGRPEARSLAERAA